MDSDILAMVFAAYLIAALIKGALGMGFSATCLPIMALGLDVAAILPLVFIPSIMSNLMVMREAGHFRETVRRFWPIYLATVPGVIAGLLLLKVGDPAIATSGLGGVLIVYGVFALARPSFALPARAIRLLGLPTGLGTGFLSGFTGTQVMPLLAYLMLLRLSPNQLVQALNCSFTFCSLVLAVGLASADMLTLHDLFISMAGLVVVLVGVAVGARVRHRLSPAAFRRIVLWLQLVFGAVLILKSMAF